MNILDQIAAKRMKESTTDFSVGDTVRVDIKVIEGDRERVQAFHGASESERAPQEHPAAPPGSSDPLNRATAEPVSARA